MTALSQVVNCPTLLCSIYWFLSTEEANASLEVNRAFCRGLKHPTLWSGRWGIYLPVNSNGRTKFIEILIKLSPHFMLDLFPTRPIDVLKFYYTKVELYPARVWGLSEYPPQGGSGTDILRFVADRAVRLRAKGELHKAIELVNIVLDQGVRAQQRHDWFYDKVEQLLPGVNFRREPRLG